LTFDLIKANLYGMFSIIPILIISFPIILSGKTVLTKFKKDLLIYYKDNGYLNPFWLVLLLINYIGIILHELIHGITWAKYTKDGFKSIRFGYFGNS
jgi:hypothetical protein